jgi:hypothetical protein
MVWRRDSTAMCPSSRSWPLKSNRDTEQNTGRGVTVRRFTLVVARNRMGHHPRSIGSAGLDQSLNTGLTSRRLAPSRHTGLCGKPTSGRPLPEKVIAPIQSPIGKVVQRSLLLASIMFPYEWSRPFLARLCAPCHWLTLSSRWTNRVSFAPLPRHHAHGEERICERGEGPGEIAVNQVFQLELQIFHGDEAAG